MEPFVDGGKAKRRGKGRDRGASVGVIARYEHDLLLPLHGWVHAKLPRRQMIEGFDDACSAKSFCHELGREHPSQLLPLFRGKIEGIHGIDNDPAVPVFAPLGNGPVGAGKGTARKTISASTASCADWAETLGPTSSVKDASVSGPREFAMATSMLLLAKAHAVRAFCAPRLAPSANVSIILVDKNNYRQFQP